MYTGLKSSVALAILLTFAASSWGIEPAKSKLSGNRHAGYDEPIPASTVAAQPAAPTPSLFVESQGDLPSNAPLCQSCMSGGHSCGRRCGGCGHHGCGHGDSCDGINAGHFCSRCNMIPHVAYINPMKSYYYFRPYQAFHVRVHQNEVISYGGDPRDPYANLMFKPIYPELEAAWAEEAEHNKSPFEDEMPQEEVPATDQDEREKTPEPADAPEPKVNTSTSPATPIHPQSQSSPETLSEKPANNTASLPAERQGTFRTRR